MWKDIENNSDLIILEAESIVSNISLEIDFNKKELIELLERYWDRQFEKMFQENKKSKLKKKYKKQILDLIDKWIISKKDLKLMRKAAKKELEIFNNNSDD